MYGGVVLSLVNGRFVVAWVTCFNVIS